MSESAFDFAGRSKLDIEMDFLGEASETNSQAFLEDPMTDTEREDLLSALGDETHYEPRQSIPVPIHKPSNSHAQVSSQPNSHGSSGSAFISSVFYAPNQAHTPPCASSYEGSVSGRLRSASEYLEERGLLDRQTIGIIKDLIIIGDEALQSAMDRYEMGDPSVLEEMIASGSLQERLPKDIDIMGDLDLDFLNVHDDGIEAVLEDTIEPLRDYGDASHDQSHMGVPDPLASKMAADNGKPPNMVSPATYDDGIGDLEFTGELDYTGPDFASSKDHSVAASPADASHMSEYERRMRSNSLFSALLNDPKNNAAAVSTNNTVTHNPSAALHPHSEAPPRWMDRYLDSPALPESPSVGDCIQKRLLEHRSASAPSSVLAATLEADRKKREKQVKKDTKLKEKKTRKSEGEIKKKAFVEDGEPYEHVPGSGRPRSLSDPNLQTSIDPFGLLQVERPDGWVGAYSPDSRRVRIDIIECGPR
jgi:hypothetical protein